MKKYYVGLMILAIITLGLGVYVVSLGISGKQDKQTLIVAEDIAEKLNDYVSSANEIPDSLQDIGVTEVPSTISYTKQSDERYEFCVEYKTASSGYSVSNVSEMMLETAYSSELNYNSDGFDSSYEPSSLHVSTSHDKGKNCQTIKPYIQRQSQSSGSFDFDADSEYCDPNGPYYAFYKNYCPKTD